jgi:hypothetical protein
MAFAKTNPAAFGDAGRARNSFNCLATLNGPENATRSPRLQGQPSGGES